MGKWGDGRLYKWGMGDEGGLELEGGDGVRGGVDKVVGGG